MMTMSNHSLAGRVVLVTGATSGIGRATALRAAAEGARVIATGRDGRRLEAVAAALGGQGRALPVDLADTADIERLMTDVAAREGRLDGLVVSAGVSRNPDIAGLDPAGYDALMDVNARGAVFSFV